MAYTASHTVENGIESGWVMLQYTSPFWKPAPREAIDAPMLWVAGGADALIPEGVERLSAAYYDADYVVVDGAGHDLMLERSYADTARSIHEWLATRVA